MTETRTIIGIPFYDGEKPEVLTTCLLNINHCLNTLGVDARIIVGVNGPRVSLGQPPLPEGVDRSRFNADIEFRKTLPGIVPAEKEICSLAERDGCQRVFLTDADISRLPMSLHHLWNQGDKPIVGANYATYPPEILKASGVDITPNEMALMRIFEADKHPMAREFTLGYRPRKRIKGSLLLLDPHIGRTMFGNQNITSDSRMNRLVPETERQVVEEAAFMHYPRTDLVDYIRARLRHFRAAATENDLDSCYRRELIYDPKTADDIALKIVEKYPGSAEVASNFLLQCALRYQVAEICRTIVSGKKHKSRFPTTTAETVENTVVHNFKEASVVIQNLLRQVDLLNLDTPASNGKGITQEDHRLPIDLNPFLVLKEYKRIILDNLGLPENANV